MKLFLCYYITVIFAMLWIIMKYLTCRISAIQTPKGSWLTGWKPLSSSKNLISFLVFNCGSRWQLYIDLRSWVPLLMTQMSGLLFIDQNPSSSEWCPPVNLDLSSLDLWLHIFNSHIPFFLFFKSPTHKKGLLLIFCLYKSANFPLSFSLCRGLTSLYPSQLDSSEH